MMAQCPTYSTSELVRGFGKTTWARVTDADYYLPELPPNRARELARKFPRVQVVGIDLNTVPIMT